MKYKYTIFVQSDYEEDQLVAKLEEIGLQKIFVEKFSDIDAIVADQNNFIDENFDDKFQRLVAAEVFPPEMKQRLTAVLLTTIKRRCKSCSKRFIRSVWNWICLIIASKELLIRQLIY
jgi:hypothetical protein